jgi:hypothetical protein
VDYNQFEKSDVRLRDVDKAKLQFSFEPETVIFADGGTADDAAKLFAVANTIGSPALGLPEKIFKSRIISQGGPGRREGQVLPSRIFTLLPV